jgi:peptidoglycan/xylan/chitin deacetylase (PgdA/CDA1 family)
VYNVPVLMFHRIVPIAESGGSGSSLIDPPESFTAQMKAFFDAGWHSITVATLIRNMNADVAIPPKTFAITFDDGWEDGYTYAFPIMRRFGFVATYFVVGGYIGEKDMLSGLELRELEAAGNEIGNHTQNHTSLTSTSIAHARQDVEDCSKTIARETGHRPVSMAYPMGAINTAVALAMAGIPDIQMALTTGYGETQTWGERYNTPRVRVNPWTDGPKLVASLTHI